VMLAAFPHCNPHYYVFTLFGAYFLLHIFLGDHRFSPYGFRVKYLVGVAFVVILLMLGAIVPFSTYDRLFGLGSPYIHVMAVYGIQGLATFLLWCAVMLIAVREKYVVPRAGDPLSSAAQGLVARSH